MVKSITLCILDGVGIKQKKSHNAVALANMPYFNNLLKKYPHSVLDASGNAVGLPDGIMGNSEVGHITIGSGRIVNQFLRRFQLEKWNENKSLNDFINSIKRSKGIVHVAGLMSDGRVHSDIHDIITIIKYILCNDLRVCIHFIADGRDTAPKSAEEYIDIIYTELSEYIKTKKIIFGSLSGRYYAMDRNHNEDRTKIAFDSIANGTSEYNAIDIKTALKDAYERGETDEFIKPTVITSCPITDKDGFVFGNYRSDRARQIVRKIKETQARILCFSQYGEDLNDLPVLLEDVEIKNTLGDILESNNKSQLRIAETEKYNHVTYFFDAERNIDYDKGEKILIPSPDVATFDLKPEMSANEITEALLPKLNKFDVVILNYANGDMVGHTGNEKAAIKAMETLDVQLSKIVPEILRLDGIIMIIADHGNAEQMWDDKNNVPLTSHTTNPVNCILVSNNNNISVQDGGLSDVAPTILDLLNIKEPAEMTGNSLLVKI